MSKIIRVLIVDDEEPGRANLRYALQEHDNWSVAAECASAASAREAMAQFTVDVIFLDIQMPRETGLVLARELAGIPEPPLVIFVTAFNAHAIEAFELHALDYLLKPFDDQRLAMALGRASAMLQQRQQASYGRALNLYIKSEDAARSAPAGTPVYWQQIGVRSVGRVECIQLAEVLWIEAAGNYVQLHLAHRMVLHRVALSQLEKHLDPAIFLRVHRSAIVRHDQLRQLEVIGDGIYQLRISNQDKVPVSERYVAETRRRMGDA